MLRAWEGERECGDGGVVAGWQVGQRRQRENQLRRCQAGSAYVLPSMQRTCFGDTGGHSARLTATRHRERAVSTLDENAASRGADMASPDGFVAPDLSQRRTNCVAGAVPFCSTKPVVIRFSRHSARRGMYCRPRWR